MAINIKVKTVELLKRNFELDAEVTTALFESGILEEHNCRRILIRDEYINLCGTEPTQATAERLRLSHCEPLKKNEVKQVLAEKYNVSYSTVEKYLSALNLCMK